MKSVDIDRNGIGSFRVQVQGIRQILVVFFSVADSCRETCPGGEQQGWRGRSRVCNSIGWIFVQSDLKIAGVEDGLFCVEIEPDDVMSIPQGSFIAERAMPQNTKADGVFIVVQKKVRLECGLRCSFLEPNNLVVIRF